MHKINRISVPVIYWTTYWGPSNLLRGGRLFPADGGRVREAEPGVVSKPTGYAADGTHGAVTGGIYYFRINCLGSPDSSGY